MSDNRERILIGILIVSVFVVFIFVYYMTKDAVVTKYPMVTDLQITKSGYPGSDTYDTECEDGAFVTRFAATAGDGISQLFVTCSDNKIMGPFGNKEGGLTKRTILSEKGFNRGNIWYENKIKGINLFDGDMYKNLGSSYGIQEAQDCGNGKIVGIIGDGDEFINNLGFKCGYQKK